MADPVETDRGSGGFRVERRTVAVAVVVGDWGRESDREKRE